MHLSVWVFFNHFNHIFRFVFPQGRVLSRCLFHLLLGILWGAFKKFYRLFVFRNTVSFCVATVSLDSFQSWLIIILVYL